MADNPKITEQVQQFDAGVMITLYEIDLTRLDGTTILRFTPMSDGAGSAVVFDGNTYSPLPISIEGMDKSTNTAFPRPRIKVSNILGAVASVIVNFNDLLGVPLRRIRTFSQFLDDAPEADPDAKFPDDIFIFDQKISHDNVSVEWELASTLDQQGLRLPRRVIQRNGCTLIYRRFNPDTGNFIYIGRVNCPYEGANSFTVEDKSTTDKSKDVCAKRLGSCQLRFGSTEPLPILAFPGVGRTR